MAPPDHNIFDNEEYHHGLNFHDHNQWVFVEASSSRRPPNDNADKCSCSDLGGYTNGHTPAPQPVAPPPQGCQFEKQGNKYYQPPPHSYASSSTSISCPEGVEREDPNLAITNSYLPLGPETGLNEMSHRRSASFHSDMSYQMRRHLAEQQKNMPRRSASPPAQDKFLPQGLYIQSSKRKNKDKKRSRPSYQNFEGYSSEDQGFVGFGAEPTAYTGHWIGDDRLFGYSSTMSEMTDELNGE